MNEQRRKEKDFLSGKQNKLEQSTTGLLHAVRLFVKNNKLKGADWIVLSRMIKRLESGKDLTSKIVRVFRHRFENIQKTYQK